MYFDSKLDVQQLETPLFDMIMDTQFSEEEGVIEMLLMSIGRLFFKVGEKDNWQFMPYLMGTSQTGKSTLLNIVKKMFNNIGVINQNFEEKFGVLKRSCHL